MSTRIGSLSGAVIDFARSCAIGSDTPVDSSPRRAREIDDAVGAVAVGAEQHVDAIGNQVVVGVGERALVRVEGREIEVLFRAAARAGARGGCAAAAAAGGGARAAGRR